MQDCHIRDAGLEVLQEKGSAAYHLSGLHIQTEVTKIFTISNDHDDDDHDDDGDVDDDDEAKVKKMM